MVDIIKIRVRGYHIDAYGHVNNTRYLEFLEEARWTVKDRYLPYFNKYSKKHGLVVANNTVDYYAPSFLGDLLRIESGINKIGNKSVRFRHDIYNDDTGKHILTAVATFVLFNHEKNISEQIPGELRKNFTMILIDK